MMKITCTPEMRRFNASVERADRLTRYEMDLLPVEWMVEAMRAPWRQGWLDCQEAATELEAAYKAISPTMKAGE